MTGQVLLLHPLGADARFWDPVVGHLEGRDVRAPDLLGHGHAPLPERGVLELFTDAVAAELEGPTAVVGLSLGGLVAQDLADRYPWLVSALVLSQTVPTYPGDMRVEWTRRASVAREQGMTPLADGMESMWFSEPTRTGQPDVVAAARSTFLATDPEGYARACEALRDADLRGVVETVGVPTLLLNGDADSEMFVAAAEAFAAVVPRASLCWLPGAAHASALEQPQAYAAHVLDFLSLARL